MNVITHNRPVRTVALLLLAAGSLAFTWHIRPAGSPKTTAELLLGKWAAVKQDDVEIRPDTYVAEFDKAGKVIFRDLTGENAVRNGTYRLEGKSLQMETPATATSEAAKWTVTIESITEEKLVTRSAKQERSEMKRFVERGEKK